MKLAWIPILIALLAMPGCCAHNPVVAVSGELGCEGSFQVRVGTRTFTAKACGRTRFGDPTLKTMCIPPPFKYCAAAYISTIDKGVLVGDPDLCADCVQDYPESEQLDSWEDLKDALLKWESGVH